MSEKGARTTHSKLKPKMHREHFTEVFIYSLYSNSYKMSSIGGRGWKVLSMTHKHFYLILSCANICFQAKRNLINYISNILYFH